MSSIYHKMVAAGQKPPASLKRPRAALLCLLLLAPLASLAEMLHGRVVAVHDGDTVTVLLPGNREEKVRLSGIDAPEIGQPYGDVSKRTLSHTVFNRQVAVETNKRDRYGRLVGKVMVGRTDAALAQIEAGMAWHFKKYEEEQPPRDRMIYRQAEYRARAARRGLWADPAPVPPWEWRSNR